MQQHVYCLGYVSFVLVMCSLLGLVLYRTRLDKEVLYIQCKGWYWWWWWYILEWQWRWWNVRNECEEDEGTKCEDGDSDADW